MIITMKRVLITASLLVLFATTTAQTTSQTNTEANAVERAVAIPKTDWLNDFVAVKIDGPMIVSFHRVTTPDEVRIVYDTKGSIISKFKAEINRNGVLCVEERNDPKRTSITEVKIFYTKLRNVKIAHAKCSFAETIESDMFDLGVSGGAIVLMDIKALDLVVECTGHSLLTLSGSSKYFTMKCSTAKVDGSKFSTVSTIVNISNSADVRLNVSERLEASTSTAAKLLYKGNPTILREHPSTFGGEIININ